MDIDLLKDVLGVLGTYVRVEITAFTTQSLQQSSQ